MARTPGRQTDHPDDQSPLLQVDEVDYFDVGGQLRLLAEQLEAVAKLIDNPQLRQSFAQASEVADHEINEQMVQLHDERLRQTLTGMRSFRRNYDFWERIIAEYMLRKENMTQRETAKLLGVSTATINRWAQHPVTLEEHR